MEKDNLIQATSEDVLSPNGQLHSVPTPLEVALKAYADEYALWAHGHRDEPRFHAVWRGDDQIAQNSLEAPMRALMIRMRADAALRAALLALAEADLPEAVTRIFTRQSEAVFRAMMRAIASK